MLKQSVSLLLNRVTNGHQDRFLELIGGSTRLEFVVAFAKTSGWRVIAEALKIGLERGLQVRITVGLSFFQTEPAFLRQVFKLSQNYSLLRLYIGDTPETFHPKIYAFSAARNTTIIIGSANLTSGGFSINYEASAEIDDVDGVLMADVVNHVDALIEHEVIELATEPLIAAYERKFEINKIHQAIAHRRASKAMTNTNFDSDTLQAALSVLKDDVSENGFAAKVAVRRERKKQANLVMQRLIAAPPSNSEDFIDGYEALITQFSSGGLHRGKTRIAENFNHFLEALHVSQQLKQASPMDAYGTMAEYFSDINNAGVNVLTEILLTLNCERFANMNKNSVAGMAMANITQFPERPLKTNVDPHLYAEFCTEADRLRTRLGLSDFIEALLHKSSLNQS